MKVKVFDSKDHHEEKVEVFYSRDQHEQKVEVFCKKVHQILIMKSYIKGWNDVVT